MNTNNNKYREFIENRHLTPLDKTLQTEKWLQYRLNQEEGNKLLFPSLSALMFTTFTYKIIFTENFKRKISTKVYLLHLYGLFWMLSYEFYQSCYTNTQLADKFKYKLENKILNKD